MCRMSMKDKLCFFTPIDLYGMNVAQRREYIKKVMTDLFLGKSYYCPSLGADIYVTKSSIKETAHHASKTALSTIVALNLPTIIKLVDYIGSDEPKKGVQTKEFRAVRTYILRGYLPHLTTKITVVKTRKGARLGYCVTAKRVVPDLVRKNLLSEVGTTSHKDRRLKS